MHRSSLLTEKPMLKNCIISESQAKVGTSEGSRRQRKLYFLIHKQLTDCGPDQIAVLGNEEKHTEAQWYRGQAWGAKRGMA